MATRPFSATPSGDLVISLLLFTAALAVRLPNLMLIPTFIDEGGEVEWALAIVQGQHLPLTAQVDYIGPFFAYFLASLMRIFGVSLILPRLSVAILGACVVVVTYWLGVRLWNRTAGLVAAGLTALSPVLVIESSHYGWSNSLTPLFVTLTLLALYRGALAGHTGWLALSGLLAALALQTHPISAVALLGMGLWYGRLQLSSRRFQNLRGRRAISGAVGLFVIGYAPMILSALRRWRTLATAVTNAAYAFGLPTSPQEYGQRLWLTVQTVFHLVADSYGPWTSLSWVMLALVVGWMGYGLWAVSRREGGVGLPIVLVTSLILYPLVVKVTFARYLAFLIPLVAVGIGIGCAELLRLATTRRSTYGLAVVAFCAPLALAGFAGSTITQYYHTMTLRGVTNAEHFRLRDELWRQAACGPHLVIARIQPDFNNPAVNRIWFGQLGMDYILTMEGCEHVMAAPHELAQRLAAAGPTAWLLTHEDAVQTMPGYTRSEPLGVFRLGVIDAQASPLTLYRLTQSGG